MTDRTNKIGQLEYKSEEAVTLRECGDDFAAEPFSKSGSESASKSAPKSSACAEPRVTAAVPADSPVAEHRRPESAYGSWGGKSGSDHKPGKLTGLMRHRLIVAGCLFFSVAMLSLNAVDFTSMIYSDALMDKNGHLTLAKKRPTLPPNLHYLPRMGSSDGMYIINEETMNGERFGYISEDGKNLISPKYLMAQEFHDGLALVRVDLEKDRQRSRRTGEVQTDNEEWVYDFIDKAGRYPFTKDLVYGDDFHDGVTTARFRNDVGGTLINTSGKPFGPIFSGSSKRIGSQFIVTDTKGRSGLLSQNGSWIVEPQYELIKPLPDDEMYGVRELTPKTYQSTDVMFAVQNNAFFGVMDSSGKLVLPIKYAHVHSFSEGVGVVSAPSTGASSRILVDTSGKQLFPEKGSFNYLTPYGDLIAGLKGKDWEFFDRNGHQVKVPVDSIVTWTTGQWFSEGLGAVLVGDKCGYVNAKGQLVIPPTFEFAAPFRDGIAAVWTGNAWRYINRSGDFVTPDISKLSGSAQKSAQVSVNGPLYGLTEAKQIKSIVAQIRSAILAVKEKRIFNQL